MGKDFVCKMKHKTMHCIKYVLLFLLQPAYKFLLGIRKSQKRNCKYSVSLCGIFKNEAIFLKEWIEYHLLVGVDHFYLYNNNSQDNYEEVLKIYTEKGIVTLIQWPTLQGQILAYKHWYENFRNETQWVSFLDIDEFICLKYEVSIKKWVEKYKKYPSVLMYWKMFGSSGLLEHDTNKLVIEQYHSCWRSLYHTGKILFNTDFCIAKFDLGVHHLTHAKFHVLGKEVLVPPVNEFGYFVKWGVYRGNRQEKENSTIQINHYWSKAWDIYERKMKSTDCAYEVNPKQNMWYYLAHEQQNIATDYTIYRFLIQLKLALKSEDVE